MEKEKKTHQHHLPLWNLFLKERFLVKNAYYKAEVSSDWLKDSQHQF